VFARVGQQTGGVETAVRGFAAALGQAGVDALAIALPGAVSDVASSSVTGSARAVAQWRDVVQVPRLQPASVLHIHNLHAVNCVAALGFIRFLRRQNPGISVVLSVHDLAAPEQQFGPRRRELVEQADAVCVHSRYMRELLATFGIQPSYVPIPFALPKFRDAPVLPGQLPFILQPTRFSTSKGSHVTLRAFAALRRSGWDGTLRHTGATRPQARDKFREFSPSARSAVQRALGEDPFRHPALRVGRVSGPTLLQLMESASAIAHPSLKRRQGGEPFGISAAQALASGAPLVISDSGNLPHLAAGQPGTWVVPSGSVSGLTSAFREAVTWIPSAGDVNVRRARRQELADDVHQAVPALLRLYSSLLPDFEGLPVPAADKA
jgi:glycosyltransferase involved in cell wall biosynthesis